MKRNAYAKINLDLHITGKRPDGYHTLETTMQSVSLCDTVFYRKSSSPFAFSCSDRSLENDKNLCVRAAKAFFDAAGIMPCGKLRLKKRVPYGAGLGGGSSDGAAVLRLLNDAFEKPLPEERLLLLASSLGADVAFCLRGGKALCRGIGDEMTFLADDFPLLLVIAKGKDGLSTPEMYRRYDEKHASGQEDTERPENDFQPVAEEALPEIAALCDLMRAQGAKEARMTGSGSAVFGVYENAKRAKSTAKALKNRGFFAKVCATVPRY